MENQTIHEETNLWIFLLSMVLFVVSFSILTSDKVHVNPKADNEIVPVRENPEPERGHEEEKPVYTPI